jgi:hypothetical protein
VYGALVIRRDGPAENKSPLRIHLTSASRAADFKRLLDWRSFSRRPRFIDWLSNSRPHLAPELQLTVRHAVQSSHLAPVEFMFSITHGFQAALRLDGWVVPLVARLEGNLSVAELIAAARKADELPKAFQPEAFADLVRMMIEKGFLEVSFP